MKATLMPSECKVAVEINRADFPQYDPAVEHDAGAAP
jgi:hypothetical protein